MRVNYINFNGKLTPVSKPILQGDNRAFRYGDGIFETMLWKKGQIRLLHEHVERLQAGMKTLKLEGVEHFGPSELAQLSVELLTKNEIDDKICRLRLQVYRSGSGLYSPISNQPEFILQASPLEGLTNEATQHSGLTIDVYREHFKPYSGLSALKSINSLLFVLAGLYRKQQGLDEVIILNQDGLICETISSNIFVSYRQQIYTPALSEGCVAGTMRKTVLELAKKEGIEITEAKIDPQILEEADEVFLTNAIRGVQWVMGYRNKRYFNQWSKRFQAMIHRL
ncbi:MAG TPA: aminotransferase class IV [Sphingobacteriaceae bacterium]|nr:aminotransferase class IV [Sphingobacteriaceae bacterium]